VALRKPESARRVNAPDVTRFDVEAVPETAKLVVVAFVVVELVKTPVEGVEAPIGVLSTVPPEMVRLFATCASVAVPTRSEKLMPSVEVALSV
jgi:hypothetical protein